MEFGLFIYWKLWFNSTFKAGKGFTRLVIWGNFVYCPAQQKCSCQRTYLRSNMNIHAALSPCQCPVHLVYRFICKQEKGTSAGGILSYSRLNDLCVLITCRITVSSLRWSIREERRLHTDAHCHLTRTSSHRHSAAFRYGRDQREDIHPGAAGWLMGHYRLPGSVLGPGGLCHLWAGVRHHLTASKRCDWSSTDLWPKIFHLILYGKLICSVTCCDLYPKVFFNQNIIKMVLVCLSER